MNNLMLSAYVKTRCFFSVLAHDLREDERGVSPIVATVLTILIAVLLAAVLWASLQDWFKEMWENITNQSKLG